MWWLLACSDPTVVLDADPSRSGANGERGPLAVVLDERSAPARAVERLAYDHLAAPGLASDAPTFVFLHGGLVDRSRYRWLGIHLASRGYRVVAPAHDLDLAIVDPSNARWVLDDLDRLGTSGPRVVGGHSLGGVIASWAWEDDPRLEGLALLASFPAGSGPVYGAGPVLSLSGRTDGLSSPADVQLGAERYPNAEVQLIDGMNHYAWVDDATESELAGDGPLERDLDEVRADALSVLDVWLDSAVTP